MTELLSPDYAIVGEGEITIIELVECIKKKTSCNKVNGIVYIDKNSRTIL